MYDIVISNEMQPGCCLKKNYLNVGKTIDLGLAHRTTSEVKKMLTHKRSGISFPVFYSRTWEME